MCIVYSVSCHVTVQERYSRRLLHAQPHLHVTGHVAGHIQRQDPDPAHEQEQYHRHGGYRRRILRQCLQRYTRVMAIIIIIFCLHRVCGQFRTK